MFLLKVFSAIFGSIIGSFSNALIYRLPQKKSIADGRSKCPNCEKIIRWYENLPIVSYTFLRGRCSGCNWNIPISYFIVEVVIASFALGVTPKELSIQSFLNYSFQISVFSCFVIIFAVDLKHKIIPNKLNLYLGVVFLLSVVLHKSYLYWGIGAMIGVLFPLAVTYLFYLIKGQIGLGGGDIKLWGALGIYLGPEGVIQNISFSCLLGSIVVGVLIAFRVIDRKTLIPFGPFIVTVSFAQIFTPELTSRLISWLSL